MINIYLIGTFLYFVFIIIYSNTKIIYNYSYTERPYIKFKLWETLLVIISFFIPFVNIIVPSMLIIKGYGDAAMLGGRIKWKGPKSKLVTKIIKFLNKDVN